MTKLKDILFVGLATLVIGSAVSVNGSQYSEIAGRITYRLPVESPIKNHPYDTEKPTELTYCIANWYSWRRCIRDLEENGERTEEEKK